MTKRNPTLGLSPAIPLLVLALWASPAAAGGESTFFSRGVKAFSGGEYGQAVVHFKAALRQDPGDAMSLYYLGLSLYHAERYEEAYAALTECGRLQPDFRDYVYHYYLGAVLYRKRLYRQAEREFAQTASLHPRSRLAEKVRRFIDEIESRTASVPEETVAWYVAAAERGLEKGRVDWAALYAEEALLLRPDSAEARLLLARIRLAQGRNHEAGELLSALESPEAKVLSAKAAAAEGRLDQAFALLKEISPGRPSGALPVLLELARRARDLNDTGLFSDIIELMERKWPEAPETAEAKRLEPRAEASPRDSE